MSNVREKNYSSRYCRHCGTKFKPLATNQQYCCKECSKKAREVYIKDYCHKRWFEIEKGKFKGKEKKCYICDKPLDDHRQFVRFECMVNQVKQGVKSYQITKYFYNRGYNISEIREMHEC